MTLARSALLPLALLALSACAGAPPSGPIARYAAGETETHAALATLPAAAGRVVAVRRTDDASGVSEQVVLEGPVAMAGENRITIAILPAGGLSGSRGGGLAVAPPSEEGLEAEMLADLPNAHMTISADPERNLEGPFGYATGTAGRLTCLYAWQYLAPKRPLSLLDGISASRPAVTSVRIRICRDLPAATLLGFVRQLSLARPDDGTAGSASAPAASAGDALDAALGPVRGTEAVRSDGIAPAPAPLRRRHPSRSAPRHDIGARPGERTGRRRVQAAPPSHEPYTRSSSATRVPMPDQVAVGPETARPDLTRASDRVRVGRDPLPLPD